MTKNQVNYMVGAIKHSELLQSRDWRDFFVKEVKRIRYERDLTLGQIAKSVGCGQTFFSELLHGKRPLPKKMFVRFYEVYG